MLTIRCLVLSCRLLQLSSWRCSSASLFYGMLRRADILGRRFHLPSSTRGIINRSFLWWTVGLFLRGLASRLAVEDLYMLDGDLASATLSAKFRRAWDRRRCPELRFEFPWAAFKVLGSIVQEERVQETHRMAAFRWDLVWQNVVQNLPWALSPALAFTFYAAQATAQGKPSIGSA
jgi:hypothetical protein